MDVSTILAGIAGLGSLAAVAVTWAGQRKTASIESDKVQVDAWQKHNQEQEARIVDFKADIAERDKRYAEDIEALRREVMQCHAEKDAQRDEMGSQIRAQREEIRAQGEQISKARERIAILEKGVTP